MGFERVCAVDEVPADEGLAVVVGDLELVIARSDEEFFALQNLCSHAAVALSEGEVADCQIECWLHGSRFDLVTGRPTGLPATQPIGFRYRDFANGLRETEDTADNSRLVAGIKGVMGGVLAQEWDLHRLERSHCEVVSKGGAS